MAETFAADGHDVVALDAFVPYYDTRIKEYNVEQASEAASDGNGTYELIRGDVRDEGLVTELVGQADVVFHQAAQAGVRTSVEQPRTVHEINVTGTLNVLEAARGADLERAVLASSSSVYGKPQYLPHDEAHPTTPISPYGASKLAGEHYGRVYHEVYGLPTVSLRYFTVYCRRCSTSAERRGALDSFAGDSPPRRLRGRPSRISDLPNASRGGPERRRTRPANVVGLYYYEGFITYKRTAAQVTDTW